MEYWSNGLPRSAACPEKDAELLSVVPSIRFETQHSIPPSLQYSNPNVLLTVHEKPVRFFKTTSVHREG